MLTIFRRGRTPVRPAPPAILGDAPLCVRQPRHFAGCVPYIKQSFAT